jgi:hypothetical protein
MTAARSEISNPPSGTARSAILAGWLLATGFCVWLEGIRILQLAQSPAGILGWFAAWNIDTTLPALVLLALPGMWWLWPVPGRRKQVGTEPDTGKSASGAGMTVLLGCLSMAMSLTVGLQQIPILQTAWSDSAVQTVSLYRLPPAYHDEFSYLLQAETFRAGRLSWPPQTAGGDAFHQIHVLNRPRTASRYFPWTGIWMLPFLLAGLPIAGHWLAGALACMLFHRVLRTLISLQAANIGGLLLAFSPGLALFSNLLLAHHPTLLALSVFLWAILRVLDGGRWPLAVVAGTALTCAMLGRPMTAAGFALPFGLVLLKRLLLPITPAQRVPTARTLICMALPLLAGFGALAVMNQNITGNWRTSAYQYYTDTWTPRHRFGFNNATSSPNPSSVLAKYDAWATNLTPAAAALNVQQRLTASAQWTLGIPALLLLIPAALPLCLSADERARSLRLLLAALISLHAVHIPYWYDGILHWHYVFETAPLLLLLAAAGLQSVQQILMQRFSRRTAVAWTLLLPIASLVPSWLSAESLWGPSRISQAVSEQAYSRVRIAAFQQIAAKVADKGPCLLLVDETGTDQQLSYIINPPDYQAPALVCRLPQTPAEQRQLASAFPDRRLYTVQVQLPDLQIRPWVVPATP